ncbi:hypothetical protein GCM10023169_22030 [Georgenia halophila]|uniref:DUF2695 domain-containing protein n=1 Tax=Georgenia halophila TaxID=620889 RepID=A0ABP8L8M9_9MICO
MSVDDGIRTLELELASLSDELTAPAWRECVLCYVNRMVVAFGCDGRLRWTREWRRRRAPRATKLERRAGRAGAYCDCELFVSGWDVAVDVVHDPATGLDLWPDSISGCRGVPAGRIQPCALWVRRNGRPDW